MRLLNKEGKYLGETIDFGILEAGKTKEYSFVVHNDSPAEVVDIKIEVPHAEVDVIYFDENMRAGEKSSLKLRWSPTLTLKKGLQSLIKITGTALYK